MQEWEYLLLRTSGPHWYDATGGRGRISGDDADAQLASLGALFIDMGLQGWELTGVQGDGPTIYFFKRHERRGGA